MKILQKEGLYSHQRQFVNQKDKTVFTIPVIDVRDGNKARGRVSEIIKGENIARGSRYIKPSFSMKGFSYNISMKGVTR